MNSLCLVPYCPWPPTTGTKVEMMKHLNILNRLGQCDIVSARKKPVGFGWTDDAVAALRKEGFGIIFREDTCQPSIGQLVGSLYAALCKSAKLERAFGHSNPYHRWAFSEKWLRALSRKYDVCVMQYGFWARFRLLCPKAIVLHELLSNYHFENDQRETRELATCDLVVVVGNDEELTLKERGVENVLWSPPAIEPADLPLTDKVGLIGTKAQQNLEGLRWLESGIQGVQPAVHVFGNLADEVRSTACVQVGRYGAGDEPYNACGIMLLTRPDRPGLQIKAVEALAYGRAIVARRGSMRGLPAGEEAWVTVDSPEEMVLVASRLQNNPSEREELAQQARNYYKKHLDKREIEKVLVQSYLGLLSKDTTKDISHE